MAELAVLLEAQAGGAGRPPGDLGDLGAARRQELEAAQTVLERGEARDLAATRVEVSPDRADDDDRAAARKSAEETDEGLAGGGARDCRKELFHLVDRKHQADLGRK